MMKRILLLLFVISSGWLGISFAGAPDINGQGIHHEWYVGVHGGPAFSSAIIANTRMNVGYHVGAESGHQFNPHMRLEVAYSYFNSAFAAGGANASYQTLMANAMYNTLPLVYQMRVFFGLGIGWMRQYSGAFNLAPSRNRFAYQGITGITFPMPYSRGLVTRLGYHIISWTGLARWVNTFTVSFDYYYM